jgi:hypothetical protein
MITRSRLRLAALLGAVLCVATACGGHPETGPVNTGTGWSPFQVSVTNSKVPTATQLVEYQPMSPTANELTVCAVLPELPVGPPRPSAVAAYDFGITAQAARQHARTRVSYATTDARQLSQALACKKSADVVIIDFVDPSLAGFTAAQLDLLRTLKPIVLAAPTNSVAGKAAQNLVTSDAATQMVTAAQWSLGDAGGLPSTAVLLPGPGEVTNADGTVSPDHSVEVAAHNTLDGTSLKIVGTYYGADNPLAQHDLVMRAMTQHPGLTYIIGTTTAATAAGNILITMNTNRRPQAVSLGITPTVDQLLRQGGIVAAMSASEVVQGRIALDRAVRQALGASAAGTLPPFADIWVSPVPIDGTNLDSSPHDWWRAPTKP